MTFLWYRREKLVCDHCGRSFLDGDGRRDMRWYARTRGWTTYYDKTQAPGRKLRDRCNYCQPEEGE